MNTALNLVEPLDPVLAQRHREDALIEEALQLLDHRYFKRGELLMTPADAAAYLKLQLAPYRHEVFALLCLDSHHRVLSFDVLFTGSIDGASVYPREVVIKALERNAAAAIFSHNHPSGCPEPSAADRTLTTRLTEALALIEVRVLDHIIVGAGTPLSLAEYGWI
ncbi:MULTISPECIES: JAB domain-containing protein [unclassified Pseudomonas]|uniref:JAB domain-containing protein n=1 Tax=unclassified Pseudomonas TaxID=196821 RepID=UPI0025EEA5F6|nr:MULTISPECIES: JAB domain-containing protein [unclassified Pseudomonas]